MNEEETDPDAEQLGEAWNACDPRHNHEKLVRGQL